MKYDLIVIGGGPGGYHAAIRAAQRGLKVALVEKGDLGGACLHRGCIPSKAYIAAAEVVATVRKAEKMGLSFGLPKIDYAKLVDRKTETVGKLARGLGELLKAHKIDLIQGTGTLKEATHVEVNNEVHEARFIVLAGGTEPARPAGVSFDGKRVLTTDELFTVKTLPKKMLIVGGGVIGCEMACAYNLLGVEVTIAERLPDLLAGEEKVVSRTLKGIFEKRGIKLLLGAKLEAIDPSYDLVLVAIGRRPAAEKLGLTKLGLRLKDGFVEVNEKMQTSIAGIYAIGDLVGKTLLAHGAMAEGIAAAEAIAGKGEAAVDYNSIPRVTYTTPEVASIGRKEEDLKQAGISYKTGRFSYLACGKALCHEEEEGFCQIYTGEDQKVLGATLIGAHASDLIAEVALVMKNRLTVKALIETVHAHPSFSEIVHEAAEDTESLAIHRVGRPPRS